MNYDLEWLETDGLGGFASGTAGGIRTRRYHALLIAATAPPANRVVLVNGLEVWLDADDESWPLSVQRYDGDVVYPDGHRHIRAFGGEPWPTWQYELPGNIRIEHELLMRHGAPVVAMRWRVTHRGGARKLRLRVRPLISGRDLHALHHENGEFNFDAQQAAHVVRWRPYASLPAITAHGSGEYRHDPLWYRRFFYREERLRGFDATEDLASPGELIYDLSRSEATLILAADIDESTPAPPPPFEEIREDALRRRSAMPSRLHRAADQYLVRRGEGKTIIAGYPWFGDWGRDTFIALRGLCLATGRLDDAQQILLAWSAHVSQGMLPNRFPDNGHEPEYNSVDAALWYVIGVFAYLDALERREQFIPQSTRLALLGAVDAILSGYAQGTRYGIVLDESDGLLRAGSSGVQLTWMDARVDGRVITPRSGKPVEVQALWLNALHLAQTHWPKWRAVYGLGRSSFRRRFVGPTGALFDVVDVDHEAGRDDATLRPNQIFAVGGLPLNLLDAADARRMVGAVESHLWTPLGLRSLAAHDPQYAAQYIGGPAQRDAVYHQGAVWPWLTGAFVEAWVRVRGGTGAAKREARRRFVEPILAHLDEAGIGHISEIADGDSPHTPRGCPFQAWSLAELLRLEHDVLADDSHTAMKPPKRRRHPIAT